MADAEQSAIKVRRVTDIHSNWNEEGVAEPGKFSFQLILDDGAEEAVIRPTVEDSDVLMDIILASGEIYFDTERRVIIFNNVELGGE